MKQARWILNISTVFLLSGIWHGATWGFVLWGLIHAVLYLIEHFCKIKHPNLLNQVLVFILVTFAWIFSGLRTVQRRGMLYVRFVRILSRQSTGEVQRLVHC